MKDLSQFRCNLFLLELDEYDCSMGGNWTIDWSTKGIVRPYFGTYCLMFSLLTIPLYLLNAQIIWNLRSIATYKILFFLAISDIMALFLSSLVFGIFLFMYYNIAHILNNTLMPLCFRRLYHHADLSSVQVYSWKIMTENTHF
ncbi:hypothetical protein PMAYCL1PPCAC_31349 [Pristionchus mayeri]|uniref:G protein-coupled receptor n=1 Tax=Pristionchus mayeri TaxID=1317129 RepID=A0AAN5IE36_9BILA|nr:hypothetical protein PMAYCL1PPCAC_31349 [Pristionchus mayeri]